MNSKIQIPDKLTELFANPWVYAVLHGGRASGKTATIIRYILFRAMQSKMLILCTREYQASIETSTYAELRDFIYENNLQHDKTNNPNGYFTVKHDRIVATNGSEIIFKGLARDIMSIKSIAKIQLCFVEEADTIKDLQWQILIPTIMRNQNAQIIIAFNPREEQSATYQRFIKNFNMLPQPSLLIEMNYPDNPFLSQTMHDEINIMKSTNYALYEHTYLGKIVDISETVIFKGCFEIKELEDYPQLQSRYGMDFGFSQDPFAMIELFIIDKNTIYINREIYEIGLLPTKIPQRIKEKMPEALRYRIYADSARPDTIAELSNMGIKILGAKKEKGSVESGIQFLQGKKIIVNPKCKNTIFELYNYKYKQDKNGIILPEPIDANNHLIDAIRYALVNEISASRKQVKVSREVLNMF